MGGSGSSPALPPLNPSGPRLSNAAQDGSSGSTASGAAAGVSKEDVLRLIRTDPQFRNELRDVITEFLQPEIEKLKEELLRELPPGSAQAIDRPKLDAHSIIQKEFPGSEMAPWTHQDAAGVVYGFPETIEIDVIKHNNMSYLCSVREVRVLSPCCLLRYRFPCFEMSIYSGITSVIDCTFFRMRSPLTLPMLFSWSALVNSTNL